MDSHIILLEKILLGVKASSTTHSCVRVVEEALEKLKKDVSFLLENPTLCPICRKDTHPPCDCCDVEPACKCQMAEDMPLGEDLKEKFYDAAINPETFQFEAERGATSIYSMGFEAGVQHERKRIAQQISYNKSLPEQKCKCGHHVVPNGVDVVSWYWQKHSRNECLMELPNEICWCGLLRSEHTHGHLEKSNNQDLSPESIATARFKG